MTPEQQIQAQENLILRLRAELAASQRDCANLRRINSTQQNIIDRQNVRLNPANKAEQFFNGKEKKR